jgi:hypothetical protein
VHKNVAEKAHTALISIYIKPSVRRLNIHILPSLWTLPYHLRPWLTPLNLSGKPLKDHTRRRCHPLNLRFPRILPSLDVCFLSSQLTYDSYEQQGCRVVRFLVPRSGDAVKQAIPQPSIRDSLRAIATASCEQKLVDVLQTDLTGNLFRAEPFTGIYTSGVGAALCEAR